MAPPLQEPDGSAVLKDAQRRRFDVVMAWAIDRLGRSLIDLLGTIQQLETCGVDLYLDQQAIDTTTRGSGEAAKRTSEFPLIHCVCPRFAPNEHAEP